MILVTRSRKKVVGLDGYGIKITKQEIINKTFLLPNTLLEANIDFQYLPCKPSLIGNS